MNLVFDLAAITRVEFGVGLEGDPDRSFVHVPVDGDVQAALRQMATATGRELARHAAQVARYDPSEAHGGTAYLYLPLEDELAVVPRELHAAVNLPIDGRALSEIDRVFCYFARFTDQSARRLTALRRSVQFKGLLKSKNMLLMDDSLQLISGPIFKLDNDFDALIDARHAHILRPSSFELMFKLQEALQEASGRNVEAIRADLPFVAFDNIATYATTHPRAARYLASIRAQQGAANIDPAALRRHCQEHGVEFTEADGKVTVEDRYILDFLEVLDRRRYGVELVSGAPEHYRAPSRQRIRPPVSGTS